MGDLRAAARDLDHLLERGTPDHVRPEAFALLAVVECELRLPARALASADQALAALGPLTGERRQRVEAQARFVRGLVRSDEGDLRAALEDLDAAVPLDLGNAALLRLRGRVRLKLEEPGGLADLDRAVELAPGAGDYLLERAVALAALGLAIGGRATRLEL